MTAATGTASTRTQGAEQPAPGAAPTAARRCGSDRSGRSSSNRGGDEGEHHRAKPELMRHPAQPDQRCQRAAGQQRPQRRGG
ncbi:hypothetical protein [Streptomyces xiamenensis]|uniref:hypothetical protein n=1 Tax=Streptomyces xiamenensis TaxID=408015 RepID=UPI0035DECE98